MEKQAEAERPSVPGWTVDIEDFGRIAEARIEMAPLVLLVGRNNSGKSYIATLIWSLLNFEDIYAVRTPPPAWFIAYLDQHAVDEPVDHALLEGWMNDLLAERKEEVARTLLSYGDTRIGKLTIALGSTGRCFFDRYEPDEKDNFLMSRRRRGRNAGDVEINYTLGQQHRDAIPERAASILLEEAVDAALLGRAEFTAASGPIYLPAARTGLMLSLPLIFGELLGSLGLNRKDSGARFPLPTINFLQQIVKAEDDAKPALVEIAAFLERALLKGSIRREEEQSPNFAYRPDGGAEMPLYVASSMVSELAPLLILLRSSSLDRGLVFEEPESHLHLSAQRDLARAIARIVHQGVPVVLTTHSDTFVQQLNILLSLHDHPERERLMAHYGYDDADLIDPASARAYEFVETEGGRTVVRRAEMVEVGFVVPSLNDVLIDLGGEALAIQDL